MSIGWQRVRIGDVASLVERPEVPKAGIMYRQIGVRLWGQGAYEREPIDGIQTRYSTLSRVENRDIILNKIWARNGSVAVVTEDLAGCFGSSEFPTFVPKFEKLLPNWFHWITKTKWFWQACDEKSRGTSGKNRIRPENFLNIEIPLPPMDEQRRIVARIESLEERVSEAQRLRREAMAEVEALWREIATQLLSQPSIERKTISEICEVRGGIQKSPAREPRNNPTPYLTVAHVQRNRINTTSDFRFFEVTPEELDRWRLLPGDLLIIEGNGSADQIGRVALFRGEIENCVHQNHVIRARPDRKLANPDYLNIFLNSPLGQKEVQKRSRTTSGLRTLSVGRIREIEIPIPPLKEQRQLVEYLDGMQTQASASRRIQSETQKELDVLLPSILDKAFKGEL